MIDEDFKRLRDRVLKGKVKIDEQLGGFDSTDPEIQRWIKHWKELQEAFFKEAARRSRYTQTATKKQPHSKAWIDMKLREALEKWQKTYPKSKRGPDPRTLPRESFDID